MCCRLGCLFGKQYRPPDDGMIRILIFGATGMTGTSVLSATLTCIWFRISVFTRGTDTASMIELRKKPLARIVEGDMFNYESVLDAMTNIDAVFFTTTYWDTMRVDSEVEQGENIIRAAMATGIKHIIYVGTPYCSLLFHEKCKYLLGKEKVEAHLVSSGLPYTILHLGFYYENFLSIFRPHAVGVNRYALALPMGDVPLNCGSVIDFGQCIAKIMLRPAINVFRTIKLATGYHTVAELAKTLDDYFPFIEFFDPKISLITYRSFHFKGSQEIATMFAYFQTIQVQWSTDTAFEYFTTCATFKEWVKEQAQYIVEAITEAADDIADKNLAEQSKPSTKLSIRPQASKEQFTSRIPKILFSAENFFHRTAFKYFTTLRKGHSVETDLDENEKVRARRIQSPSQDPNPSKTISDNHFQSAAKASQMKILSPDEYCFRPTMSPASSLSSAVDFDRILSVNSSDRFLSVSSDRRQSVKSERNRSVISSTSSISRRTTNLSVT